MTSEKYLIIHLFIKSGCF